MTNFRLKSTAIMMSCILLGSVALAQDQLESKQPDDDLRELLTKLMERFDTASPRRRLGLARQLRRIVNPMGLIIDAPAVDWEVVDAPGNSMLIMVTPTLIPDDCENATAGETQFYAKVYDGLQMVPPESPADPEDIPDVVYDFDEELTTEVDVHTARKHPNLRLQTLVIWEVIRHFDEDTEDEVVGCRQKQYSLRYFYGHEPDEP